MAQWNGSSTEYRRESNRSSEAGRSDTDTASLLAKAVAAGNRPGDEGSNGPPSATASWRYSLKSN
jgi:hypothetical protein